MHKLFNTLTSSSNFAVIFIQVWAISCFLLYIIISSIPCGATITTLTPLRIIVVSPWDTPEFNFKSLYVWGYDGKIKWEEINPIFDNLPESLLELAIYSLDLENYLAIDHLPSSLTKLILVGNFNAPIDHLPASLKYLQLRGHSFNQHLDHLPGSLEVFKLTSNSFSHPIATCHTR